ncbi:MAG: MGMT family protein [Candidatus Aenigmarchaeota archaeon]|nr:MGMT family protein [Candidatus Aenigmarchaeota archaeon]
MHNAIRLLKKIPGGKVTTYKELARAIKTHPRAIGMIMRANRFPSEYPCYKVVMSDGCVGGYSATGGQQKKIKLLEKDGIKVHNSKIDLGKYMFRMSATQGKLLTKKG